MSGIWLVSLGGVFSLATACELCCDGGVGERTEEEGRRKLQEDGELLANTIHEYTSLLCLSCILLSTPQHGTTSHSDN